MNWLHSLWGSLTAAHPSLQDQGWALRLRLLAGVALVTFGLGAPASLGVFVLARDRFMGDPALSLLAYVVLLAVYLAARSRHASIAMWALVVFMVPMVWGLLATSSTPMELAVCLPLGLIPLLLAALMPDPRALWVGSLLTLPSALMSARVVAGADMAPLMTGLVSMALVVAGIVALQTLARADHDEVVAALQEVRAARHAEQVAERSAREALAVRERFLSSVHHELRTPLHGVMGAAELLQDEPDGQDAPLLAAAILDSARRLDRLVSDVLAFVGEGGALVLEPVDVAALCDLLVGQQTAAPERVQLKVTPSEGVVATVDAARFSQVVDHLLRNAVAFTDVGRIDLRVSVEGSWLTVEVQDTGCGMSAEQLERAFEPLRQGDERLSRSHEGLGLGLAASRTLARSLGGDVQGTSVPGKGSVFTLRLPAAV